MSKSMDSGPDITTELPADTGGPDSYTPDDAQSAAIDTSLRTPEIAGERESDALASDPASPRRAELNESSRTTRAIGTLPVAGEIAITPIGASSRHGKDNGGEASGTGTPDGHEDNQRRDNVDDHSGEPPEHGDTSGELAGDEDPEAIRQELEMRAVQRSSQIIRSMPIDVAHATTIANGQADIAIAVGVRRDPATGNNTYDTELLAQVRASLVELADRMGAEQSTTRQMASSLREAAPEDRDTDRIDELQIEAAQHGLARSEIETGALTRIMTAETIAGSTVAERMLAERIMEDRDHVSAYRSIIPDTIIRPKGDGKEHERSIDYANTYCITKAAEELGEPMPEQVLAPEDPEDTLEYEARLLLLEHDWRLGQTAPGATSGNQQASERATNGVTDILTALEADSDEQPNASQLIGTFPRLLAMAGPGDTKQRLTTQYLDKVEPRLAGRHMDSEMYADLVKAGCVVYDNPSIFNDPQASSQVVSRFSALISDAGTKLRLEAEEHGDDPLLRNALIDQAIRYGAEWNARMSTLQAPGEDSAETVTRISTEITPANLSPRSIDEVNLIYARELSKAGETPTARVLIEMFMRDETMIADALAECLQVATVPDPIFGQYHPDRVEAFQPHPSMVRDLPDVGLVYNAAAAITHDDITRVDQATRDIVSSLDSIASTAENTEMKFQWIDTLLSRADALDAAGGLALRRAVLPEIQATAAANLNPHNALRIYQTLMRSGQIEDYRAMRAAMNRIGTHEQATNDQGLKTWGPLARMLARPPIRGR